MTSRSKWRNVGQSGKGTRSGWSDCYFCHFLTVYTLNAVILCHSSARNLFFQTRNPSFQVSYVFSTFLGRHFKSLCWFGILKCDSGYPQACLIPHSSSHRRPPPLHVAQRGFPKPVVPHSTHHRARPLASFKLGIGLDSMLERTSTVDNSLVS
jgi:hypothetical protein